MNCRTIGIVVLLTVVASASVAVAAPSVEIVDVRVGFSGHYRVGHMTPVFVRLDNSQPSPFEGELRATQKDDDGEGVRWRAKADLGAGAEDEWRMLLICPQGDHAAIRKIQLSVVDASDRVVASRSLADLPSRLRMVDLESRVVGVMGSSLHAFQGLVQAGYGASSVTSESVSLVPVPTGGKLFPLIWQGLDMIDVLYWDNPDLAVLDDQQQAALAQWIRRGGRLVVGLGPKAGSFSGGAGELTRMFPVIVKRVGKKVRNLAPLGMALVGRTRGLAFNVPVHVVSVRPKTGTLALATDALTLTAGRKLGSPLLCIRPSQAGSITVMAVSLAEWYQAGKETWPDADILAELLGMGCSQVDGRVAGEASLSEGIASGLDSAGVGGMLVTIVVLLVLAYAAVAGPGTWLFLRYRRQRHLSWWAFALVVAIATVASVLLSRFPMRSASVSNALVLDLHDARGGDWPPNTGVVRGYFGLYVPSHRSASLSLPDDAHGKLMPMIDPHLQLGEGFPDPRRYDLDALAPMGVDAPVRRTIKRFALDWTGDVGGSVKGDLKIVTGTSAGRPTFVMVGTLKSTLPVPLRRCTLLYCRPDGKAIDTLRVPDLHPGKLQAFPSPSGSPSSRDLKDYHGRLLRRLDMATVGSLPGGIGQKSFLDRVQLMTTLGLLLGHDVRGRMVRPQVGRSLFGRLDRSELLQPGWAILIAEAEGYMPAKVDFDDLDPDVTGTTVVRVLMHVKIEK